jgi:DNA-damage-inducible protein D
VSDLKAKEYKQFEDIKVIRADDSEYWPARELAAVLDYTKWENFSKVIDRAMLACRNSGFEVTDHFPDVKKMVDIGSGTKRRVKDYELTRYACYLIVQNGDPRKEVIALGQTYFAIQTYRQEIADKFNQLDENNKRLVIRGDIKQWNQMLAEAAHDAGVITNEEFAIFQNAGYMGLYGGLTVEKIHDKKGLAVRDKILDYMGSEELIANLFRVSQTESKLRRENIKGSSEANQAHYVVGREVRAAIHRVGGTMPEELPTPEKSISKVEREQIAALKESAKKKPLMLDE